jgi:hypothetical protein
MGAAVPYSVMFAEGFSQLRSSLGSLCEATYSIAGTLSNSKYYYKTGVAGAAQEILQRVLN